MRCYEMTDRVERRNPTLPVNDGNVTGIAPCAVSVFVQLGHDPYYDRTGNTVVATPSQVSALADKQVRGVACGFGHTVVVLAGGECLTCGWNKAGQCGNGSNSDVLTPIQVHA